MPLQENYKNLYIDDIYTIHPKLGIPIWDLFVISKNRVIKSVSWCGNYSQILVGVKYLLVVNVFGSIRISENEILQHQLLQEFQIFFPICKTLILLHKFIGMRLIMPAITN